MKNVNEHYCIEAPLLTRQNGFYINAVDTFDEVNLNDNIVYRSLNNLEIPAVDIPFIRKYKSEEYKSEEYKSKKIPKISKNLTL